MADGRSGIAGLPADGSTMVSGLPTAPAEESAPPDWPLAVLMTAVAVLVAWAMIAAQWDEVDGVRGGATAAVTELPRSQPREQGSYIEPANFRKALDEIGRRAGGGAKVQLMRVDAGQVWTVLDVKGRQRVIRVSGDGITDDKGGQAVAAQVRLDSIDPQAPQRMLRGIQEKLRVSPAGLDYFSLAGWNGTWGAYFKDGGHFGADPSGRKVIRIG